MDIQGIEGLSVDEVRMRVNQGGRFVIFTWTLSFIVMTVRRPTAVTFVNPGESATLKSMPYTLISLFFGWWGIPWGFIYTPMSIIENLGGGRDVTNEVMQTLGAGRDAPAPVGAAAPSDPGSAFRGEPGTMKPAPRLSDHTAVDGDAKAALYLGLGALLCFPAGWLGLFFGVRAIGRARSHGLSTPVPAVVGIVLGSLTTLCSGSTLLFRSFAPSEPEAAVTRRVTPEAVAAPEKDDGTVVQPGGAQRPHLGLRIAKSYEHHQPSAKPPFHEPGGEWTYLDLEGGEGVELTVGIHFKKSDDEMFAVGSAELSVPTPAAGAAFTSAFDAKFGGEAGKVKPKKKHGPLKVSAVVLGQDVKRHRGGSFGGQGTWVATKLSPELDGRQGEVFFNFSLDEGRAELTEKDSEYADDLAFVFHTAFAGK